MGLYQRNQLAHHWLVLVLVLGQLIEHSLLLLVLGDASHVEYQNSVTQTGLRDAIQQNIVLGVVEPLDRSLDDIGHFAVHTRADGLPAPTPQQSEYLPDHRIPHFLVLDLHHMGIDVPDAGTALVLDDVGQGLLGTVLDQDVLVLLDHLLVVAGEQIPQGVVPAWVLAPQQLGRLLQDGLLVGLG